MATKKKNKFFVGIVIFIILVLIFSLLGSWLIYLFGEDPQQAQTPQIEDQTWNNLSGEDFKPKEFEPETGNNEEELEINEENINIEN